MDTCALLLSKQGSPGLLLRSVRTSSLCRKTHKLLERRVGIKAMRVLLRGLFHQLMGSQFPNFRLLLCGRRFRDYFKVLSPLHKLL